MNKSRIEAFSDGVFSIVITLLILNIKLPAGNKENIITVLPALLPSIFAYVLSFLLIGLYWIFHHHSFLYIEKVDGFILWLNIAYLLLVSFLPFPTLLMGEFRTEPIVTTIYGINILLINIVPVIFLFYLKRNKHLTSAHFTQKSFRAEIKLHSITTPFYIASILLAFISPAISLFIYCVIAVGLIIYSAFLFGVGTKSIKPQ